MALFKKKNKSEFRIYCVCPQVKLLAQFVVCILAIRLTLPLRRSLSIYLKDT